jgi:hypothetical protein
MSSFHANLSRPALRGTLASAFLWLLAASLPLSLPANPERQTEHAVLYLASQYEPEGFDFRSDIWQRELRPDIGKAVRIQMFKGNDYRVCIAVPPKSGVQIEAHLLDANGKKIEHLIQTTEGSWGSVLHVKPPATGVYMLTIRRSGGAEITTSCSMISGYK